MAPSAPRCYGQIAQNQTTPQQMCMITAAGDTICDVHGDGGSIILGHYQNQRNQVTSVPSSAQARPSYQGQQGQHNIEHFNDGLNFIGMINNTFKKKTEKYTNDDVTLEMNNSALEMNNGALEMNEDVIEPYDNDWNTLIASKPESFVQQESVVTNTQNRNQMPQDLFPLNFLMPMQ